MSTVQLARSRNTRLHQDDWLLHALETLRRRGVSGLRVEPLARSLGVTTGSFYWHFKDRQDLLDRLLEHWTDTMTAAIAERKERQDGAGAQLASLLEEVTREDWNRFEIAIRSWAIWDPSARRAVRTVDECRLAYVEGLFRELGFSHEQAEIRAYMLIFYQVGEAGFSIQHSLERRLELAQKRLEILTSNHTEA